MNEKNIIESLKTLVVTLGVEVEDIKKTIKDFTKKEDKSPLTVADTLVNNAIIKTLNQHGQFNIISEETKQKSFTERKLWDSFWLIDPIDGTKEFLKKNNDYTINISYFNKKKPKYSLIYVPATQDLYEATRNKGAVKNGEKINVNKQLASEINVVASKSHCDKKTEKFINLLEKENKVKIKSFGSSLKICKIAEGEADIYPRFAPTMEWDTAAADLILKEAGGILINPETKTNLKYNKKNLTNPYFIAASDKKYIMFNL